MLLICSCQLLQLKQEFAGKEMKRLREELQEKHEAEISALRSELDRETEEERTRLEKALHEEKEKLKSLQAALDSDESEIIFKTVTWVVRRMSVHCSFQSDQKFWKWNPIKVVVLHQLLTCCVFI